MPFRSYMSPAIAPGQSWMIDPIGTSDSMARYGVFASVLIVNDAGEKVKLTLDGNEDKMFICIAGGTFAIDEPFHVVVVDNLDATGTIAAEELVVTIAAGDTVITPLSLTRVIKKWIREKIEA